MTRTCAAALVLTCSLAVGCTPTTAGPEREASASTSRSPGTSSTSATATPSPAPSRVSSGFPTLKKAYTVCRTETGTRTELSLTEKDSILTLHVAKADNTVALDCVLRELATPQATARDIKNVRSKSKEFDSDNDRGLDYTWSYSSQDSGVHLIVEDITDL